ncbi:MAG: hypothetical protein PF483_06175 [Halothiobacillus sp.]|nr:hypothetical protein [Halothiobacillus sp.]
MSSLTVDIELNGEGRVFCTLSPNLGVSDEGFAYAVQEFKKNVLDYQLRLKIKLETEPVRNLILGLAFSRTGLQGSE